MVSRFSPAGLTEIISGDVSLVSYSSRVKLPGIIAKFGKQNFYFSPWSAFRTRQWLWVQLNWRFSCKYGSSFRCPPVPFLSYESSLNVPFNSTQVCKVHFLSRCVKMMEHADFYRREVSVPQMIRLKKVLFPHMNHGFVIPSSRLNRDNSRGCVACFLLLKG